MVELLDARVAAESKPARSDSQEAHFSPGWPRMSDPDQFQLLNTARQSVDICVFTITDDRISQAILAAHGRGVGLRILTDNEKAEDLGSDIARFREAGIPVCIDRSQAHMHHKFAIFDGGLLLTGSYNWISAAEENEENFVLARTRHVGPFQSVFDRLWERLHATGQC
ncbi:MAG: phospholipase D-like domain-containing protein [Isosphaeraceae bacterium]